MVIIVAFIIVYKKGGMFTLNFSSASFLYSSSFGGV